MTANYDYLLSIGFDPTAIARVNTTLQSLAQRVSMTRATMSTQVTNMASTSGSKIAVTGLQQQAQALQAIAKAQRAVQSATVTGAGAQQAALTGVAGAWGSITSGITHALGKIAMWGISTGIIYGGLASLRSSVQVITEIDFALTGLRKVYQGATSDVQSLGDTAIRMTSEWGGKITSTIQTMTAWARQGYNMVEIITLTRASLVAQNIAELDATKATGYLTAAINQFNLKASDAMMILDTWNELSNRYAATTEDIASGVTRLGKTAEDAGVSLQLASSMVAVLVQNTKRTGEEVGTALRTLFTYAYREKNMKILQDVGIFVRRQRGELMPLVQVLEKLSISWDTLTQVQQQAIAQAFGVRRITEFRTLLNSLPQVFEANRIALTAEGSSIRENVFFLESLQVKWQRVQASMQSLIYSRDAQRTMKRLLDDVLVLIQTVHKFGVGLSMAAVALIPFLLNIKAVNLALTTYQVQAVMAAQASTAMGLGWTRATVGANALTLAAQRLWAALSTIQKASLIIGGALLLYEGYKYATGGTERKLRGLEVASETNTQERARASEHRSSLEEDIRSVSENYARIHELTAEYKAADEAEKKAVKGSKAATAAYDKKAKTLAMLRAVTGDASLVLKNGLAPAFDAVAKAAEAAMKVMDLFAEKVRKDLILSNKALLASITKDSENATATARLQMGAVRRSTERLSELQLMYPTRRKGETEQQTRERLQKEITANTLVSQRLDADAITSERVRNQARAEIMTLDVTIAELTQKTASEKMGPLPTQMAQQGLQTARERKEELQGSLDRIDAAKKDAEKINKEIAILEAQTGTDLIKKPEELAPADPYVAKLKKQGRAWENLSNSAKNAIREINQALVKADTESLGPWYSHIIGVEQKFEDLKDRAVSVSTRIGEELKKTGIPKSVRSELELYQVKLANVVKLLDSERTRVFWEELQYAMEKAGGGARAILAEETRQQNALNKEIERRLGLENDVAKQKILDDVKEKESFRISFDHFVKLTALRKEQIDLEEQMAQAKRGRGWEGSVEQLRAQANNLASAERTVREYMAMVGPATTEPNAVLDAIMKLTASGQGGAGIELRKAYAGMLQFAATTKESSLALQDATWDYKQFLAEEEADLALIRRIRDERIREAQNERNLPQMISLLQEEIGARKDLLSNIYAYNTAIITAHGNDIIMSHAAMTARAAETKDLSEQLNLWHEMVQLEQSYTDWKRQTASAERRAGMDSYEQSLDTIKELQDLLSQWDVSTEKGQQYFDELHGMAVQFIDQWKQGARDMADSFSDAIVDAVSGGSDIWNAIHSLFASITKEWMHRLVRQYMGSVFEGFAAAGAGAAGHLTGPELAKRTGVLGRQFAEMPSAETPGKILEKYQLGLQGLDAQIDVHKAKIDEEIAARQGVIDALRQEHDAIFGSGADKGAASGISFPGAPGQASISGSSVGGAAGAMAVSAVLMAKTTSYLAQAITDNTLAQDKSNQYVAGVQYATPGEAGGKGATSWGGKWGLPGPIGGLPGAIGLYSAYQAGDPLTGALLGYSLGQTLIAGAAGGPIGAAVGLAVGLYGKSKNKSNQSQSQTPQKEYPSFWSPSFSGWSTTPNFSAANYTAYAQGAYGAPYGGAFGGSTPYGVPSVGMGGGRGINIGTLSIHVPVQNASGNTEIDGRRLATVVARNIALEIQRESAARRQVR